MRQDSGARGWRPSGVGLGLGLLFGLLARDLELRSFISYWQDVHAFVLIAAIGGALLWNTRARLALQAGLCVFGLAWLLVAFTPLAARLAEGLVRRDALQPADAVFVLASKIQRDGELTGTAMTRLLHGLELVGEGRAPRLILSELWPPSRSYSASARAILEHMQLKREVLTVGPPIEGTRDEARLVAQLCREHGWTRLIVVTSPVHSRRAAAAFEREGLVVLSSPCVETRYDLENLPDAGDRLMAFGSIMHERIGLWVYRRRGWI
jgi:uncharacterized SAM-binding protein YcdF (DUF218 family)